MLTLTLRDGLSSNQGGYAMRVKEVAELTGVSVRTLHHYDEMGLLKPDRLMESGYREYSDANLELLQQIMFFRALGFPLKRIREMLAKPDYDRQAAMELQRKLLLEERSRLDAMLATLEKTIKHYKGEVAMSRNEMFQGFDISKNPYEQEARERWGDQAVDESKARLGGMDQQALAEEMNELYRKLADIRHMSPESEEVQAGIHAWFVLLNRMGSYSLEAFKGLGLMYVEDERFTRNIDQFGEGLAAFLSAAMGVYADRYK